MYTDTEASSSFKIATIMVLTYFVSALLLKQVLSNENNTHIDTGEGGAGLKFTEFLGQLLPMALFDLSARSAAPGGEERARMGAIRAQQGLKAPG